MPAAVAEHVQILTIEQTILHKYFLLISAEKVNSSCHLKLVGQCQLSNACFDGDIFLVPDTMRPRIDVIAPYEGSRCSDTPQVAR
jgi:hypothetical protein